MPEEVKPLSNTPKKDGAILYLRTIIEPLCLFPDKVVIESLVDERGLCLNVKAHNDDLPFLIGRGGKIASAIRDLLHIWGARNIASVKVFICKK